MFHKNNHFNIKKKFKHKNSAGFTLVEILVSLAIFSIILLTITSSFLAMQKTISKTKANMHVTENARRALNRIAYEIKSSKGVYTPTTTATQLSLETTKYLPEGEINTFVDFFLCGNAICFKKESQNVTILTPDSIQITNLNFLQLSTGTNNSVQTSLTANYKGDENSSINLTSTASLRNY